MEVRPYSSLVPDCLVGRATDEIKGAQVQILVHHHLSHQSHLMLCLIAELAIERNGWDADHSRMKIDHFKNGENRLSDWFNHQLQIAQFKHLTRNSRVRV